MAQPLLKKDQLYTYEDYLSWDEDFRCELIDGVAYALATPLIIHQRISRRLSSKIDAFLDGKPCELFYAPTAVKFNLSGKKDTILEPDLFVVCDKSKLDGKVCNGAPDLVIEIVSPSSVSYDCINKFHIYLQAKVREYWIVYPDTKMVNVFVFDNGHYVGSAYSENDKIPSSVLEGLIVDLNEIFAVVE